MRPARPRSSISGFSILDDMTGDRVRATIPEMVTAPGQGEGELPEERAGQPPLQSDRQVDRRQGDGHGDDRPDQFAGADQGRLHGGFPSADVALDVFQHDDGVVDHEADREDDRQQGEEVHGEPECLHQEDAADQGQRDRHHRDQNRAEGADEEENDDHDDEQRVAERLEHLPDGVRDVVGGVVRHAGLESARQAAPDRFHLRPHPLDHVEGVGVRERPDPHEGRGLPGKVDFGVVILRPERHVGDVAQPDDGPVPLAHHQAPELADRAEIGVGGEVDLDEFPLAPAERGQEVVGGQGLTHLRRADVERRHPVGLEPDAHGEGAGAEDVGPLHALEGGKARLDDAHEIVGDLVLLQDVGAEAQIRRGEPAVGRLDVDDRDLRLRGEVPAHLVHLGADLGQGLRGIVVEPEAHADRGEAEGALRFHVLDAVGGGDGTLQRAR